MLAAYVHSNIRVDIGDDMDLSQWKYAATSSNVPAGKPFVIDGHVCVRVPPTGDQAPSLMAVLTGANPGLAQTLRTGPCIYFDGEVAFEAATTSALISAGRGHGQSSAGCLVAGADGFSAIVELKGHYDSVFYGFDVLGQLLPSDQVEDSAFTVIRDWKLVLVHRDGRRTDLAQVSVPKQS